MSQLSVGQNVRMLKTKILSTDTCQFMLDTLYVLPASIVLKNAETGLQVPDSLYVFDFNSSVLAFSDTLCNMKTNFVVMFKTIMLPVNFSVFHKDYSLFTEKKDTSFQYQVPDYKPFNPYNQDGLVKQGAISRGISLGNTRGGSLQSSLDLRLSGRLNNDIDILAVITDNNIPIQPEGNTQQLQEFDKVFIELRKHSTGLRVGDIDLLKPAGYFLNYSKKSQGGLFYTTIKSDKTITESDSSQQSVLVSGGISKGKFSRNTFQGVNGNQGPYRLTGAENEMFIMILAGTERVFINGEQMNRGNNYDYVIDYNTAELTFTANRIITSDHRIVIEFEYSDKHYVRSLFTGQYEYTDSRATFRLNVYSEQDARNQPLQQILDEEEKFVLQLAGDNPLEAVVPGWDSLEFSGDYVMYAMIDTLGYDSIFVYSTNPTQAVYRVNFSFVGEGNGNYIPDQNTANGRVFKWVQPAQGTPSGHYDPIITLVTPKKQQMVSTAFTYKISERAETGIELALSNQDMNTFSSIDNQNNTGTAGRIFFRHTSLLNKDTVSKTLSLLKEVSYEFTEARFIAVDRFRPVEFYRDWNISATSEQSNEHMVTAKFSLMKNKLQLGLLQSDYLLKSGYFNGLRNQLNIDLRHNIFRIRNQAMYMYSDRTLFKTSFFKQKGTVSSRLNFVTIGTGFEQEVNMFRIPDQQLMSGSYNFFEFEPFLTSVSDTSKVLFRIWYKQRTTQNASSGHLRKSIISNETGIRLSSSFSSPNKFSLTGGYRSTTVKDTALTGMKNDHTIISKLENNLHLFQGVVTSFMFYEIGSGLESKKEFSFMEVQPGQGNFTWIDYNQNGIKELNEFETANYQDEANYIKILLPSNEYVRSYTLQFHESLNFEPLPSWKTDSALYKRIISLFSNRFQYSLNKNTNSELAGERFLPLDISVNDTSLIMLSSSLNNTLFFNRAHPVFHVRYRYSDNINKSLLIHGFESRQITMNEIQIVWNMTKSLGSDIVFRSGNKSSDSELSPNRSFHLNFLEITPGFNFQPSLKHRYSVISRYKVSENHLSGNDEKAVIFSVGPEIRFPLQDKHIVHFRLTYHLITFNAPTSSPIAYEMLESLEPGQNFTWNLMLQYVVNRSFQINFMYEGRRSEGKKTIHFGTIQLKAIL